MVCILLMQPNYRMVHGGLMWMDLAQAKQVAETAALRITSYNVCYTKLLRVADSFSTDDTAKIAEEYGARVVQIPFEGFGRLRNDAIAACTHEWIFSLDSDERCTMDARDEIKAIINAPQSLDAYYVPRKNYS